MCENYDSNPFLRWIRAEIFKTKSTKWLKNLFQVRFSKKIKNLNFQQIKIIFKINNKVDVLPPSNTLFVHIR